MKLRILLLLLIIAGGGVHAGSFASALEGKLVRWESGQVRTLPSEHLASKKLIALYYSADWCGACRQFTPLLAQAYAQLAAEHPQFELIFISRDHGAREMESYMKEAAMPFPALAYSTAATNPTVNRLASRTVPYLAVVDADGNEVAGRGGQDWAPPDQVILKLQKLLAAMEPEKGERRPLPKHKIY